jgi:transmembrane sensor
MQAPNPDQRWLDLAEKWVNGTITKEEEKQYAEWYNTIEADAYLEVDAQDKASYRAALLARINARKTAAVIPMRRRVLRAVAVAAALIVLAGTVYVLLQPKHVNVVVASNRLTKDVAPGKNAAILTLSDGKQILLEPSGKRVIATEGNAVISNGEVAYANNNNNNTTVVYHTLSTRRGNESKVILPDGSIVWLNAESSVRYPTAFTGKTREIEVTGEVYVQVKHDAKQPFITHYPGGEVYDIGTEFNINAYADETGARTTLVEGAIKIKDQLLKPGQQFLNGKVTDADLDAATAWKNGLFDFQGADIATVMRQVARWYDLDVELRGTASGDRYSGRLTRSITLNQLIEILQITKMHFTLEGKKLIVMP